MAQSRNLAPKCLEIPVRKENSNIHNVVNDQRQDLNSSLLFIYPPLFNQNKQGCWNSILSEVAPLFLAGKEWRHRIQFALSAIWLIGGGICCPHCRGFRVPGFQLCHSAHAKLASGWIGRLFQLQGRFVGKHYPWEDILWLSVHYKRRRIPSLMIVEAAWRL